ncbi:hypothetical protein [Clostridium perfringens]|uniref:hypothetical protein n=1 Tax=Clostridium perfringens TaxID=1502 RepID=UPI000F51B884|nr:hypothetical protein [Clostridium perfringens]
MQRIIFLFKRLFFLKERLEYKMIQINEYSSEYNLNNRNNEKLALKKQRIALNYMKRGMIIPNLSIFISISTLFVSIITFITLNLNEATKFATTIITTEDKKNVEIIRNAIESLHDNSKLLITFFIACVVSLFIVWCVDMYNSRMNKIIQSKIDLINLKLGDS